MSYGANLVMFRRAAEVDKISGRPCEVIEWRLLRCMSPGMCRLLGRRREGLSTRRGGRRRRSAKAGSQDTVCGTRGARDMVIVR
jgi:hypothetical protein